jgi:NADPH:quinone reductase-like Zn-dependent oxidoreductase
MRAVVITRHGAPEVLEVQERPDPTPGAGEVVVDVRAVGVNFAEVMARMGLYAAAPKPPCVVGYEVAGTIAALGSGVTEFAAGERVMAGTRFGGYAERVVAKVGDVVRLPDEFSFEEGAAVPVNYATAWAALRRYGNVQPGERVLIHAAAGGVGIAATQIAKASSCEVWGTASPSKHDAIRQQGVDHVLDYTRPGWERGIPKLDLVMDAVGGKSFRTSYELMRSGGRLVCFGASAVVSGEKRNLVTVLRTVLQMPRFNVMKQMEASKTVIGLNALALWDEFGDFGNWVVPALDLIWKSGKRPVVAAAIPFDRAADAHRLLSQRKNVGKVVLVPR